MKKINFKEVAMRVGGISAGAVAANAIYKIMPTNMKPALKSAIILGAGALLPELAGGGKTSKIIESVGDGMVAFGALGLAKAQFNLDLNISGIESTTVVEYAPAEVVETSELAEAVAGIEAIANAINDTEDIAYAGEEDDDDQD